MFDKLLNNIDNIIDFITNGALYIVYFSSIAFLYYQLYVYVIGE